MMHRHIQKFLILALFASASLFSTGATAQLAPANNNTVVKTAPNGVPIVNIANPNAAGLSNNLFTDYNVGSKGIVLNNQDVSKLQAPSQLAGTITANTGLQSEATVILNQVISTNRSTLAGYTEVVGGAADVIVANPNGITCSGCGFINTPRVTLTTGTPVIANGGAGALTGFSVNNGDILISGQGLDATNTNYIGLFARSIALQGQVNAKYLDIVAGANSIDYATQTATAQAGTGAAPTVAIDSSILGGMYADRIRLVATEAGVGVHMLGDASTGAGDFTLTSAGKIDLGNHITTKGGHLRVTSTDSSSADSIKVTDAVLLSQHDLSLTAATGNIHLTGSLLNAQGDMALSSATLTDEADANVININGSNGSCILNAGNTCQDFNNQRYAAGALTFSQSGAAALNGTTVAAAGALGLSAGSLHIGATENVESTGGDVTLTSPAFSNEGIVSVAAGNLIANSTDSFTNTGTLYASNDVTLDVLNTLTNSSNILAGHNLTISRTGSGGTLTIDNNTTSGVMQAVNQFTIQGVGGDHAVDIDDNTGYLLANSFNFDVHNLTNSNIIQSTLGASTVSVSNTLHNISTAKITLGTTAAVNGTTYTGNGTINANTINDDGVIESAGTLALNAGSQINTTASTGKIVSSGNLTIRGLTASNYTINNSGIIQSVNGTLDIGGQGTSNAVNINNGSGVSAALYEGHDINWNANAITFTGNGVKADNNLTISASSLSLTNSSAYVMATNTGTLTVSNLSDSGAIFGTNSLTVNSPSITVGSTGALASTGTLQINLTGGSGAISNSGALYAGSQLNVGTNSGSATTNYNGTFTNQASGTVNSGGNAFFGVNTFTNSSPNFNIAGNAIINANTFNNNIPGNFVITWDYLLNPACVANPAVCFVPNEGSGRTSSNLAFGIPDGAQDSRYGAQSDGHNTASGGIQVDDWHYVDLSGNQIGGAYSDDTEHVAGIPTDETTRYLATFDVKQQYVGAAPTSANRPNMIVGGTLTIENFQTASNKGGDISAPTINISTTKAGATFTNDDLSLKQQNWEAWWDEYSPCDDRQVDDCDSWQQRSYDKWINSTTTISSFGAGIFATNLNTGGFSLIQNGASQAFNITTKPAPTTGTGTVISNPSNNSISFGGIVVTLPTNPNGLFITNPDPGFGPLIETNSQYSTTSPFLGPDYMVENYGLDPDSVERQLGDANYDAQLIQQQLVNLGASQLLGTTNQAAALQQLMDNGVSQGKALGLTIGVAPTAAQLASIKSNMVWLVDTVVNGQHVLAPMVYLSEATKTQIASGAVIQASNANIQLVSLTNNGGTISGSNTLNIGTTGDINNISGKITGGNVSLSSSGGSINNQTLADFVNGQNLANTGTISSTGDLSLNAANNIANTGANVTAGGNVSLNAGHDITFNTIQDVQNSGSSSSSEGTPGLFNPSNSVTMTTTIDNVGSGLTVGGNLTSNSGHDTTFTGSNVNVGGNANLTTGGNLNILAANNSTSTTTTSSSGNEISGTTTTTSDTETTNAASNFNIGGNLTSKSGGDTNIVGSNVIVTGDGSVSAGGDLNILDGQNTSNTYSKTSHSGLGVGGGVYGNEDTTDTDQKSDSVASNLHFGGNGSLSAGNDVTLRGSNAGADGNLNVDATNNVNVLAGQNTDNHTHSVSTTTFGKIDGGSSTSDSSSGSGATAGTGSDNGATASADAHAEAGASNTDNGGVTFAENTTTTTTENKSTAVGSTLSSGGDLTVNAGNALNVNGSNVNAGGNATVNAKDINVTAAQNTDTTTTTTTDTKVGLYGTSDNKADAGADANADAQQGSMGNPSASASATANAEANSDNTLALMQHDESTDTVTDITHTGGAITSGGNMNLNARNNLNVAGSSLAAGGDATLNANNMSFTAVQDSHTETKTDSNTQVGLYANSDNNASAGANAGAQGLTGSAGANAEANAYAGVGLYGTNTTSGSVDGSTTALTSSITSGGNLTRNATNDITDQGTQITAGGDFSQSSKTWESQAAHDTTFSSSTSETNTAKLGLYAQANASAGASASTTGGTDKDAGADASAGLQAQYQRNTDDETSSSSNAVVSNIKAGGNVNTTTTGAASLEGTNMTSGGDMNLNAGSLDYKAAHNTSSSSSSTTDANANLQVGVDASKKVDLNASADYGANNSSNSSSTAVTGSMNSGGNLHVKTGGDANFEGTNLNAGGSAGVDAGGSVNFSAAHNTSTSSSDNLAAGGSISLSKGKGSKGAGVDANASYDTTTSNEDEGVAGSITSGNGLSVTAGKNATFEGTNLTSGGDTNVAAGGDVNFNAVKHTSSTTGYNVGGSLSMSGGSEKDAGGKTTKTTSGGLSVEGGYNSSSQTTSTASNVNSGGKVNISSGHDTNLEGTNIASADTTTLNAGHDVNFTAATNTSSSIGVSGGLGGNVTNTTTTDHTANGGKPTTESEKDGNANFSISGGTSTTRTGGSIKSGGGIAINSGNDTTLEGTQTQSAGNTTVNAGGNVNLKAAQSSDVSGGLGVSTGKKSTGVSQAGIDGGSSSQSTNLTSGGDLTINSGGKTTMQGSQLTADGAASVNAQGGVDQQDTVSGRAGLSLSSGEASLDVQKTKITSKNQPAPATSPAQVALQKSFAVILNNPNLTQAQKVKMMSDKIKNDPDLTAAEKTKMLADLAKQNSPAQ